MKPPPLGSSSSVQTQGDRNRNSNRRHDQDADGLEGGPPAIKTTTQNSSWLSIIANTTNPNRPPIPLLADPYKYENTPNDGPGQSLQADVDYAFSRMGFKDLSTVKTTKFVLLQRLKDFKPT